MPQHSLRLELCRGSEPEMAVVWDRLKAGYAKRYRGWNDAFDGRYREQSLWFVVYQDNQVQAASRLVLCNPANPAHAPLSFTRADKQAWQITPPYQHPIECEGAGLTYTDRIYLPAMYHALFGWLEHQQIPYCFAMYDKRWREIGEYHREILHFTHIDDATVAFSDFCYNQPPYEPVEWQLGVQDSQDRQQCLKTLRRQIGFVDLLEERHWQMRPPLG